MPPALPLLAHDLATLALMLRRGECGAGDLVGEAVGCYGRWGERLGAWKTWAPGRAGERARGVDEALKGGRELGALQGLPVSVKDLYGVEGLPTFAGTVRALPERWQRQGVLVNAIEDGGGIIMGKTHTVELAFGGLGVNGHWGTPYNPWDAHCHRVPGGSSSGAGVSLSEGSCVLALGTDTSGSVRIPASMTGAVGLKVSRGRWSMDGIVPLSPTLDSAGTLTRSVCDAVYAFAALDPSSQAPQPLLEALQQHAMPSIGVIDALFAPCENDVAQVVSDALTELARGGLVIAPAALPEADDAIELLQCGSVVASQCADFVEAELGGRHDELDPPVRLRILDGANITALEYLSRLRRLEQVAQRAATRFAPCRVLACPTLRQSPPALAAVRTPEAYRPHNMAALSNTCCANMLNLCAITIPVGLDRNGMPVGLQLMAPHGEDELLLAVALRAEQILGRAAVRLGTPPALTATAPTAAAHQPQPGEHQ